MKQTKTSMNVIMNNEEKKKHYKTENNVDISIVENATLHELNGNKNMYIY